MHTKAEPVRTNHCQPPLLATEAKSSTKSKKKKIKASNLNKLHAYHQNHAVTLLIEVFPTTQHKMILASIGPKKRGEKLQYLALSYDKQCPKKKKRSGREEEEDK